MRAVVLGVVLTLAVAHGASAAWTTTTAPGGIGGAMAATMAGGNQPTASVVVAATAVDVSWPATAGPVPVAGYVVRARAAADATPRPVGGTCAGVVAGTACRDLAAAPGSWEYTIAPVRQDWNGAESPPSQPVGVVAPVGPQTLALANGNGRTTPNVDEVRLTFPRPLDASSICSAWTGTGDHALRGMGVVVTITDNGNDDVVTVASSACHLHVGSVATGRNNVSTTTTYLGVQALGQDSRVTWTAASKTLTIHLGALGLGVPTVTTQAPATVIWTPDPALAALDGAPIDLSPFSAADQRF